MALAKATGLEMKQINQWFINARVRIWKPLSSTLPMSVGSVEFHTQECSNATVAAELL